MSPSPASSAFRTSFTNSQSSISIARFCLLTASVALLLACVSTIGCGGGSDETADNEQTYVPEDDSDDSPLTSNDDATGLGDAGSGIENFAGGDDREESFSPGNATGSDNSSSSGSGTGTLADNSNSNATPPTTGNGSPANGLSSGDSGQGAGVAKPPTLSGDTLDESIYTIPENAGKNELVAFIGRMNQLLSQTRSAKDEIKIQRLRINAAERLLTPELDPITRLDAIRIKVNGLQRLVELGDETAEEDLLAYSNVLTRAPERPIASYGEITQLSLMLRSYFSEQGVTYDEVLKKFTDVVTEYKDQPDMFVLSQNLVNSLYQLGQEDKAEQLLQIATEAFLSSPHPQIQAGGDQMRDQLKLMQLGYERLRIGVFQGEEGAADQLAETSRRVLASGAVTPLMFSEVLQSARLLEITGNFEQARAVYQILGQSGENHSNQQLAHIANLAPRSAYTRMDLIGKPLEVTGKRLDGEPFDWASYRGKHVLIVFWATKWQESLANFADYARVVDEYKSHGVEVLGINCDEVEEPVQQLLSRVRMDWPTLIPESGNYLGIQGPMPQKCGVDSAPCTLLVDPAGRVVALHLYQQRLFETLNNRLGIPNEPKTPAEAEGNSGKPASTADPTTGSGNGASGDGNNEAGQ